MGNLPIVFAVIGRKETISDAVSDLFQWTSDGFAEATLIAYLIEQFNRTDEIPVPAYE